MRVRAQGAQRGRRRESSVARALPRSRVTSNALAHPASPVCRALTHHQQKPEEGQEVAGLGGLQPEEVHADDGEHDHEEP